MCSGASRRTAVAEAPAHCERLIVVARSRRPATRERRPAALPHRWKQQPRADCSSPMHLRSRDHPRPAAGRAIAIAWLRSSPPRRLGRPQGTRTTRLPARNQPAPRSRIRGTQQSSSRYRVPCIRALRRSCRASVARSCFPPLKRTSPSSGVGRPLGTSAARLVEKRRTSASFGCSEREVSNVMPLRALLGQRALSAVRLGGGSHDRFTCARLCGRRRSSATLPGYDAGRPPRNKGLRYLADPPTVEEIIAVMRQTSDDRHGYRLRALIIVLWRGGLRIQEALALGEGDLDPRRRSLLVRNGKGGRQREIGMDAWGREQRRPWLAARVELPIGPLFCVIDGPTRGRPWSSATRASSFAGSPARRVSGAASRRTSCATPTQSSSRARACRST